MGDSQRETDLDPQQALILRKLLAGIARMSGGNRHDGWEPRYGRGLIIQMLIGSEEQRIGQFNLHRLSTYGILRNHSPAFLRELADAAIRAGMVFSTGGTRPLISLTPKGDAVMRDAEPCVLSWPGSVRGGSRDRSKRSALTAGNEPADGSLVEALRQKRQQLAKARGNVPAYQILTNRALEALAERQPQSPAEALEIPGIGPAKARTVVPTLLKVIAAWRSERAP